MTLYKKVHHSSPISRSYDYDTYEPIEITEEDVITEIMNNGMAGVFDEDGVVLCYDVNANMAAKAIMKLLKS